MPHFGLMDTDALGPVEAPLMRARLHIRAGKRRLRQGKISAGIVTLYDALSSAMNWYVAVPERISRLNLHEGNKLKNEKTLFSVLTRYGILDGSFDFESFDSIVEIALESDRPEHMKHFDYRDILTGIESVMLQLGVMPFDEDNLPKEDPDTF
jgi:hypothetical protein